MIFQPLDAIETSNAALEARFADKLRLNPQLNRQLVSFQAGKHSPGYRWFKYKEAFSEALVGYLLDHMGITTGTILDPFAGIGTTLFAAKNNGFNALGIELLPVGIAVIAARSSVDASMSGILERWLREKPWQTTVATQPFPHLRITSGAFPAETQHNIEQYLAALAQEDTAAGRILHLALMCILEEISYTRKDGQYLRWDYRSGRKQGAKPFDKGAILTFEEAITHKLGEIIDDLKPNGFLPGFFDSPSKMGTIEVLAGSCLDVLPTVARQSVDGIITSPPYANRYDYTRTYALELALLGVDEEHLKQLRQQMLSCTVENRPKLGLPQVFSPALYQQVMLAFEQQQALQAILAYLEQQKSVGQLNNAGIPRMIRNYFFELALLIFESARVMKPGAPFVMVNDNVRYGGAMIPVDLILADFAEQAGFDVEVIWVLPRGKGNSSQQMGLHGREEVRKCIYIWRRRR